MERSHLPVAVIGAGPIGLAAAAHLVRRGLTPLVIEAGDQPAASVREWGHVRVFSPWSANVDAAARDLLAQTNWSPPDPAAYPTGDDLCDQYLLPLAAHPAIAPHLRLNTRVTAVTRLGLDKLTTAGREHAPFVVHTVGPDGTSSRFLARAVIDASGTWTTPNPLGANGIPAEGEAAAAERIAYGIPDVLSRDRERYAGRRVLVVGSGHSAFTVVLDLVDLARAEPDTRVIWAVRRNTPGQMFGGGAADMLPQRGALGMRARALVESGAVTLVTGFRASRVVASPTGVSVASDTTALPEVDQVVVAAGFRPNLDMLRELHLALDPVVESPTALAPLIDPNIHSCGSVPPHGFEHLAHPEPDFYIAGVKSYGRAPTFLMLTGYEQVRSIVAALAGDWAAARDVRLVLPETGVCSVTRGTPATESAACCGAEFVSPQPAGAAAHRRDDGRIL